MSPSHLAAAALLAGLALLADAIRVARRSEGGSGMDPAGGTSGETAPEDWLPYLPMEPSAEEPAPEREEARGPAPAGPDEGEPARRRRTLILTHRDFDGLLSAALLLRAFDPGATLRFTTPGRLGRVLPRLAAESGPRDRLLVADLGLDDRSGPQVLTAAAEARSRGVEIRWFDHHSWPDGMADRLRGQVDQLVLEPERRTAAEAIRARLLPEEPDAGELLRLFRPAGPDQPAALDRGRKLLAGTLLLRDDERTVDLVRRLASGLPDRLSWTDRSLIRRAARTDRITRETALQEHRTETTDRGRRFLVIDVRPFRRELDRRGRRLWVVGAPRPGPMVARGACRSAEAEFALVLWSPWRYSLSRADSGADFRLLFDLRAVAGRRIRIAGHPYAAGVVLTPRLRDRLRLLVDWEPPSALEDLIRILRERL